MRAMSYSTFRRRYKPMPSHEVAPDVEHDRDDFVEHPFAAFFPPERVWTVIEGDNGKWYISAGFHVVNRTGYYVVCEVPHDFPQRDVLYL